jgi:DNA mismatch repair protein MutL
MEDLTSLGFCIEIFGKNDIKISGVPPEARGQNEKELFEGLLDQYKNFKHKLSLNVHENLARSMARRAGIKHGKSLEVDELKSVIDNLFGCDNPNFSPDGRPVFYILGLEKIEESFK